jgi:hypothetical protein
MQPLCESQLKEVNKCGFPGFPVMEVLRPAALYRAIMYVFAQIAAGFAPMLRLCGHTVRRGETMKRSAIRRKKPAEPPIAWREAEYAAPQASAAGPCDDCAGENSIDFEDERTEVDIIVHGMSHGAS